MKEINRRDFLKVGTLGVTAVSLGTQFSGLIPIFGVRGRNISRFSKNFRKGIPTMCNLCPARCGVVGFLNHEWLAAIQGNPRHINNRGKICARGIAGINQVYDPERILYPLKRTGDRGEGKWKRIGWDEALNEIFKRLKIIRIQGREEEFVFHAENQNVRGLTRKFLNKFGQPTVLTSPFFEDSNKIAAQKMTWGENIEINDAAHCSYFLNFGCNPYESHPFFINFSQRIIEARINRNAKLITIDPRLSNTAGKSDEWIPIKPGTDAIVALSMANVIMQKELYNAQFINEWTNVTVAQLKAHLAQFNLETAAHISNIDAATIERIATEFAMNKPAIAFSGGGVTQHINGTENERCIMLLNAIVGNIDIKGGVCLPRRFDLKDFTSNEDFEINEQSLQFFQLVKDKKKKVGLYFTYMNNPAYEYPDCQLTMEVLKDENLIPFNVVMDTVMSETASLADLVLPATTFMESWTLDSSPSFEMLPFISMAQPVITPLGESMALDEIWIRLADMFNGTITHELTYRSIEDYIKEIATSVPGLTLSRDYDQLKKYGIWTSNTQDAEYQIYRKKGFNTPSRKFEIAPYKFRRSGESPLPKYIPIKEHLTISKSELILIPYNVNVLSPDLANLKWLSEINHTNMALLNAKTAQKLKIKEGDTIILESNAGRIELKSHITQGIHPHAIAISNSLGHWEYGRIAQAKKFDSEDPDTKFIWWEDKGIHPNTIIPVSIDPSGKGQGWNDTKVKIRKA